MKYHGLLKGQASRCLCLWAAQHRGGGGTLSAHGLPEEWRGCVYMWAPVHTARPQPPGPQPLAPRVSVLPPGVRVPKGLAGHLPPGSVRAPAGSRHRADPQPQRVQLLWPRAGPSVFVGASCAQSGRVGMDGPVVTSPYAASVGLLLGGSFSAWGPDCAPCFGHGRD